jgi:hypothetical protein
MNLELIASFIDYLNKVRVRPHLYIGDCDPHAMSLWIGGFTFAVHAALGILPQDLYIEALTERGWKHSATFSYRKMLDCGLTPKQVIDELLMIEIQVYERCANRLRENAAKTIQ